MTGRGCSVRDRSEFAGDLAWPQRRPSTGDRICAGSDSVMDAGAVSRIRSEGPGRALGGEESARSVMPVASSTDRCSERRLHDAGQRLTHRAGEGAMIPRSALTSRVDQPALVRMVRIVFLRRLGPRRADGNSPWPRALRRAGRSVLRARHAARAALRLLRRRDWRARRCFDHS